MKQVLIVVSLLFWNASISVAAEPSAMKLHDSPQPLPSLAFTDQEETPLTLEVWRGKVVLLNIWATWCGPCRREMPTLDHLQAVLGSDRFEVVALSIDRAGVGVVRDFFNEIEIRNLEIFIDESGTAARDLQIFGLPATILISPEGEELGRLIGPAEWDTLEMIDFFEAMIRKHQGRE